MAVKRCKANINVVTAAERRIINVFKNGLPVYMSFSGGKDSLCLSNLVLVLIQQGKINPAQLIVQFIDEEAIFPCIEKVVFEWRKKFLLAGAKFEWYCIEVKHFNCFNELSNDESFICWDRYKKDVWVRQPPPFALRTHKLLKERVDTYQQFLDKKCSDGMCIVGVRTAESLQRLQNFARIDHKKSGGSGRTKIYPIYDWKDCDVWLYLKQNNIDIPDIYLYLWQSGTNKRNLRVSQFFSVDTARCLVKMNEYYPNLMERIIRREPNAYLASLYWDSEMFGRSTRNRKVLEDSEPKKDYKVELIKMFADMDTYFPSKHKLKIARAYKNFFIQVATIATESDYQHIYEGLISGDPKSRTLRALYQRVYSNYVDNAKKQRSQSYE